MSRSGDWVGGNERRRRRDVEILVRLELNLCEEMDRYEVQKMLHVAEGDGDGGEGGKDSSRRQVVLEKPE